MSTATGKEIELKLRVDDEAALRKVAQAAGGRPEKALRQVNHFFDTAARDLDKGRFVMRLRDEDGTWFLTAKGPAGVEGTALKTNLEEEITVDAATAQGILAGTVDAAARLADPSVPTRASLLAAMKSAAAGKPLCRIGAFSNERTRLPTTLSVNGVGVPVVLELDKTTFPGDQVHFEVEVELPGSVDGVAAEAALRALFAKAGVEGRTAPGKAKRFFAALAGKPI